MTIMRKIGWSLLALVTILLVAVLVVVVSTARNPSRAVGVQLVQVADPGHPSLAATLYYPTSAEPRWRWFGTGMVKAAPDGRIDGQKLPLVVISHGTAGAAVSHIDLALALAEAGYVVAAPMHTGDNFQDSSKVGTRSWMVDRARHIARVNDFLFGQWDGRSHLDAGKVGFFGFSAGGTTGLIALGGDPDPARIKSHCAANPEFVCKLMTPESTAPVAAADWTHDARFKAAVIVSPGLGFMFGPEGLSGVDVPVQLWAGAADQNVPLATNAALVDRQLKGRHELQVVEKAGHFSFLPPCGLLKLLLPQNLCADPEGFDRAAFQERFNHDVVRYFDVTLARR